MGPAQPSAQHPASLGLVAIPHGPSSVLIHFEGEVASPCSVATQLGRPQDVVAFHSRAEFWSFRELLLPMNPPAPSPCSLVQRSLGLPEG